MIDPDDLASGSDLASLVGVSPAAVSYWRKRHDDFPNPVAVVSNGHVPIFSRSAFVAWYARISRISSYPPIGGMQAQLRR